MKTAEQYGALALKPPQITLSKKKESPLDHELVRHPTTV
jgi:hypothetical protein